MIVCLAISSNQPPERSIAIEKRRQVKSRTSIKMPSHHSNQPFSRDSPCFLAFDDDASGYVLRLNGSEVIFEGCLHIPFSLCKLNSTHTIHHYPSKPFTSSPPEASDSPSQQQQQPASSPPAATSSPFPTTYHHPADDTCHSTTASSRHHSTPAA